MKADFDQDSAVFTSFDGTTQVSPEHAIGPPIMSNYRQQHLRRLAAERLKRQIEPTALYVPMPEQERFHRSNAKQRILRGCVAGETEIYDPVAGVYRRVDQIDADFHVHAWDGDKMVVAAAHKPFLKGVDDLYRVRLDNGSEFISTLDHRVWSRDGWISVGEVSECLRRSERVLLPSTSAPCPEASPVLLHDAQVVSVEFVRTDRFYDLTVPFYHCYECRTVIHHNSNRAGKTLTASIEISFIVSRRHPYLSFPKTGRIIAVGTDEKHIGHTMWDKLVNPIPKLRMIKDEHTRQWRVYRWWTDRHRQHEARGMQPLIPERLIESVSYRDKGTNCPAVVKLKTGWEIWWFTGSSNPPRGLDVDVCLAPWAEIYDPVLRKHRRVDSIPGPFHVWSYNTDLQKFEIRKATKPFIKGYGEIVRVHLSNGQNIETTRNHRVLTMSGEWVSVQEAFDMALNLVAASSRVASECRASEESAARSQPTSQTVSRVERSTRKSKGPGCHPESLREVPLLSSPQCCEVECGPHDQKAIQDSRSRCCVSSHPCDEQLLGESGASQGGTPSQGGVEAHSLACSHVGVPVEIRQCSPAEVELLPTLVFQSVPDRVVRYYESGLQPLSERGQRFGLCNEVRSGSLGSSFSGRRTSRGPVSHPDSGRDCAALVSFSESPRHQANGSRTCATFGSACKATRWSETPRHSASEECLLPEKDEAAKRTYPCHAPGDEFETPIHVRSIEAVGEAPIFDIGVEVNHNYVYGGVVSHNCWFDEEIRNPDFHRECMARLVDRGGKFFWSATPQTGGQSMWDLHLACEEYAQKNVPTPPAEEFVLTIDGNKYLDPEEVSSLKETYKNDPETYRVRILGEYLITSFRVYPTFNISTHVCDPFHIPDDWCRYIAIDPGHVTCAVLFFAVPPDRSHIYVYDELYIRDCNASMLADKVREKVMGHNFQAFIIDYHGSIRTEAGGMTIGEQYSEAFRRKGIYSNATNCNFIPSKGDVESGLSRVREWLSPAPDEKPFLQFFAGSTENIVREMQRYHKKRTNGIIVDKPEQNGMHAVDALRYGVMHGMPYKKPNKSNRVLNPIVEYARKRRKQKGKPAVVLGHVNGIS